GNQQATFDNISWTQASVQNIDSKLYTVEFYRDTNLVHNIPVLYNTNIDSYNLEVEGHTLVAWKDAEGNVFDFNTPIKSNLKLYAELEINKWNVSFNTDGGTVIAPLTDVEYGSEITKPTDPVKEGYTFVGWFTDPSKTVEVEWPYIVPNQDSVLYAKFEANEYTIITDEQGGSTVADITLPFGSIVPEPQAPTKEGFNFVGWYLNLEDDQPIDFNTFTMPLGGTTIYAKWVDSSVKYTVTFDLKGGIGTIPAQEITAGDLVTKPSINPTKDGFTFIGWSSTEDGSNLWDFDNDLVSDDMTLYAVWEEVVVPSDPETLVIDTSGKYDKGISDGVIPAERLSLTNSGTANFTISFYKNNSSTITIFNNSGGEIRLYAGSGNGGQLTIEIEPGYKITEITIKTSQNGGLSINGGSSNTSSTISEIFELGLNQVVIKNVALDNNQVRITDITITYLPE
ncbi:MAG TPA: InlB B-repeat-containing protein, partial [Acholeplasma sp.]|nr:InlB B-repeat-containing protein [Acholeplasma sp.]